MNRVTRLSLILLLVVAQRSDADELPRIPAEKSDISSSVLAAASSELEAEVSEQRIAGGMHMVLRHGGVVHFAIAGVSDIDDKTPMKADTIMRIYSMSKPITSVAAMKLWEAGRFRLDDPLQKYIPAFKDARVLVENDGKTTLAALDRPILVRDLFRHSSGYSYGSGAVKTFHDKLGMLYRDRGMFPPAMSIAEAADVLARIPLLHQPGERFTYGLNTDLLGRLIEIWSKQPLDEYLADSVFRPLGMIDSGFHVPEDKAKRFASCHASEDGALIIADKAISSPYLSKPAFLSGGGGLVSTMEDYARFCQMLVNGGSLDGKRLLQSATVQLMFTNQLGPASGDTRFGLGFAVQEIKIGSGEHERTAMAYRWGGYANTAFQLVPSENMAQVFMRQLVPSDHRVANKLFPLVYRGVR